MADTDILKNSILKKHKKKYAWHHSNAAGTPKAASALQKAVLKKSKQEKPYKGKPYKNYKELITATDDLINHIERALEADKRGVNLMLPESTKGKKTKKATKKKPKYNFKTPKGSVPGDIIGAPRIYWPEDLPDLDMEEARLTGRRAKKKLASKKNDDID